MSDASLPPSSSPFWLPPESPLPMPVQDLRTGRLSPRRLPTSPAGIGVRRALVMGNAVLMTLFATYQIWWVLRGDGIHDGRVDAGGCAR